MKISNKYISYRARLITMENGRVEAVVVWMKSREVEGANRVPSQNGM
jgi:hypothetical protein